VIHPILRGNVGVLLETLLTMKLVAHVVLLLLLEPGIVVAEIVVTEVVVAEIVVAGASEALIHTTLIAILAEVIITGETCKRGLKLACSTCVTSGEISCVSWGVN